METTTEVQELSLEKVIDSKLVQNNVTKMVIAALKEKFGGLRLKTLDDKESYLEIKAAAREVAKVRTLAVKICKEGREEAVKTQKAWIAKEKEVVGELAEVEDPLDGEVAKFDNEVKRLEAEEKQRQETAYINRQAQLTKLGATYVDGSFVLGEASFESALVKECSQDVWEEAVVPKFQAEYEQIEAVKVAEQKKKDDEAAELKKQQDALAEQQKAFEDQQKEFARKQAEAQKIEEDKKRADELEKERAQSALQKKRFELMFPVNPTGEDFDMATLWVLAESDFSEKLAYKTEQFNKAKAEKEKALEDKRLADIEKAKQDAIIAEQKRQADTEEAKRQEEVKKQMELEAANDKTKWEDFINQVKEINTFEMRSGQYRKKMQIAKEKIDEILSL
jgi:hypothetical protein